MKLLLPVDGSACTKRMLSYVAAHEELLGPNKDYTFVTVVSPIPDHMLHEFDPDAVQRQEVERADHVLGPVRAFADQHRWRHESIWRRGHTAEEISRLAEGGRFDLIVMGSHGHTAYGGDLLGSVASGVLSRCKVPVLIVR